MLWLSALESLGFIALYHMVAPWWRTPAGRSVMALGAVLAAVLTLGAVRLLTGDSLWFAILRLIVFSGLPVEIARRTLLLVRLQLRQRRAAHEEGHHATPGTR